MSRPLTPPTQRPQFGTRGRFVESFMPVENLELYRPDGLHPVNLGDEINGIYRVMRKLGYGSSSTVWLAQDLRNFRLVAIKITGAAIRETSACNEVNRYKHLASLSTVESKQTSKILGFVEDFAIEGPNGIHTCLVLEPMGPTAEVMIEQFPHKPQVKPQGSRDSHSRSRFPLSMAKSIIKQVLISLNELHSCGIVHADVRLANILFGTKPLQNDKGAIILTQNTSPQKLTPRSFSGLHNMSAEEAAQQVSEDERPTRPSSAYTLWDLVERRDGKQDLWAPTYLLMDSPLMGQVDCDPGFVIKLFNLGQAFSVKHPPAQVFTSDCTRAPELVLGQPIDEKIDIWSFGCLVYNLLCGDGHSVIEPTTLAGGRQEINDQHLILMSAVSGPFPASVSAKWSNYRRYFNEDGSRVRCWAQSDEWSAELEARRAAGEPEEDEDDQDYLLEDNMQPLEDLFRTHKPSEIDDEEASAILEMLRKIFQYDRKERPSAAELLEEQWMSVIDTSGK